MPLRCGRRLDHISHYNSQTSYDVTFTASKNTSNILDENNVDTIKKI